MVVVFKFPSVRFVLRGMAVAASFLVLAALMGCDGGRVSLAELEAELHAAGHGYSAIEIGEMLEVEKPDVKLGFIKLTDCAPLVIAKEKGFFSDEGLNVTLEAQSNWKVLLDRVIDGQLDGAHMLAGQPIGATIGFGTKAPVIAAYSMGCNGNAITVSNRVWEQMQENDPRLKDSQPSHPITADALKPVVDGYRQLGRDFNMGMVFPVSTHNYEIRYWLAAAGIHPGMYTPDDVNGTAGADVLLSVTPPPQMPSTLENGTIEGYCVGEPWNQQAVVKGIGVPVTTSYDIWKNSPQKVFGVTESWNKRFPNTHIAVLKALIRAGKWLDETSARGELVNRDEAAELLSRPQYVGADKDVIKRSMTGAFTFQKTDVRPMPEFNVFFDGYTTYPHYSDCIWFLTQMRRWGQVAEAKSASWYASVAQQVYQPAIYRRAAQMLIREGRLTPEEIPADDYDGYRPPTTEFIDGNKYDARDPIAYINSFAIGAQDDAALAGH